MICKLTLAFICLSLLIIPQYPAFAQDVQPPVDAWGEVVNADGSFRTDTLTDLGVVTQETDWMPNLPGVGPIPAEYHQYVTDSGNIILAPTATTYFFMALNSDTSGMDDAASSLSTNGYMSGGAATDMSLLLSRDAQDWITQDLGFVSTDSFFQSVIDGQTDIWTLPGLNSLRFFQQLLSQGLQDGSFYTALLLYTPDQCASVPGGCPPLAQLTIPTPPPLTACPARVVQTGEIEVSAMKTAPNYLLVVGQDPGRRGGDVTWTVRVNPTIVTLYTREKRDSCLALGVGQTSDCTRSNGKKGITRTTWRCVRHVNVYRESLNRVNVSAALSPSSKNWILNTLSIRYPGAYLHNPSFRYSGNVTTGGYQGDVFVWTFGGPNIQFADPGYFGLGASGLTTGTAYSQPRGFDLPGGKLDVYLKEIAIIQ